MQIQASQERSYPGKANIGKRKQGKSTQANPGKANRVNPGMLNPSKERKG